MVAGIIAGAIQVALATLVGDYLVAARPPVP
jgi:hypothetical protein